MYCSPVTISSATDTLPAIELIPLTDHGPYCRRHSKLEARRTNSFAVKSLQETFSGCDVPAGVPSKIDDESRLWQQRQYPKEVFRYIADVIGGKVPKADVARMCRTWSSRSRSRNLLHGL